MKGTKNGKTQTRELHRQQGIPESTHRIQEGSPQSKTRRSSNARRDQLHWKMLLGHCDESRKKTELRQLHLQGRHDQ